MNFEQTGLPDRPLFRTAFGAGLERAGGDIADYLSGPVALARLIYAHGGDCRQVAAAACLAGHAAFSSEPDPRLDQKVRDFAQQVVAIEAAGDRADRMIPNLSPDARLFFQVSAIAVLDRTVAARSVPADELQKTYAEALDLYSAARGSHDTYGLDTLFEIAAMKVTTALGGLGHSGGHLWVRAREYVQASR